MALSMMLCLNSDKNSYFKILQGSVATLFRWSWEILSYFVANLSKTLHINFYQNQSSIVEVMIKNLVFLCLTVYSDCTRKLVKQASSRKHSWSQLHELASWVLQHSNLFESSSTHEAFMMLASSCKQLNSKCFLSIFTTNIKTKFKHNSGKIYMTLSTRHNTLSPVARQASLSIQLVEPASSCKQTAHY